jgi:hypothetical protein
MQKTKSIPEIYQEVKDFDIVITNDAALKDGINQQIKKAFLGQFAYTPKELATEYSSEIFQRPLKDKPQLTLILSEKLNISIKQAHHLITNIFDKWEKSPKLTEKELTRHELSAFEIIKNYPNICLARQKFNFKKFLKDKKTAVIAYNWLTELDKETLPNNFETISPFKNKKTEPKSFFVFNSEKDVISKLSELINKQNQNDIAVIVPKNSNYSFLAKSKLINKGINIRSGYFLKNHINVRIFLGIIDISLNITNKMLKEASPYIDLFNIEIDSKFNNYKLDYYINRINKNQEMEEFYNFLLNIRKKTYHELIKFIHEKIKLPPEFIYTIKTLSLLHKNISAQNFDELTYYIDNFDISIKEQSTGVLFVDSENSAFVNRPICFYLGLDNQWNSNNKKQETNIKIEKFQALLQQGQQQFYFVSEFTENQLTIPCYYFNVIENKNISNFNDVYFKPKKVNLKQFNDFYNPDKTQHKTKRENLELFSQSSFNNFVSCPKKYSYSKIVPREDQPYFLKGTLLHEFAEFYFEFAEFVKEKGLQYFINVMVNKYKRMVGDLNIDFEKTLFEIAAKNITNFIDSLDVKEMKKIPFKKSRKKQENIFSIICKKPLKSLNTEAEFEDYDYGIKGIIDLIIDNSTIVDYKTSSFVKRPKHIISSCTLDLIENFVDFQPAFYLMELRRFTKEKPLKFRYNYILANKDDMVEGKKSQNKNIVDVKYLPFNFSDFLASKECICLLASSKLRSSLIAELKDYKIITSFFKNNPFPKELQYDYQKLSNSEYSKKFHSYLKKYLKEKYSYYQNVIDSLLKTIVWIRTGERQKQALLFKEDIDNFEKFLQKNNQKINIFLNKKFPYSPINQDICNYCEFNDICLKKYNEDK